MAWNLNFTKDKQNRAIILLFGIFWIIVGIRAIFKSAFHFRGVFVDLTGYNIQVGSILIIFGIAFIGVSFRKSR